MKEYMKIAYKEALKAYKKNEVPVGAVIIKNDKIISKSHNNRQTKHNVLGHAEINSIIMAEKKLKDWRLDDCVMYITMEPCEMCSIIINESRIKKVIYLVKNKGNKINNKFIQTNDCVLLKKEYEKILKTFFQNMRK